MLATAGLMLSVAALLIVIGIGWVTIEASENHRHLNLFANPWFDVGLFVAGVGMLWGAAAVASVGSQASACREFPDVEIRIMWRDSVDTVTPATPDINERPVRLVYMHLLVSNRERSRTASLYFNGTWPQKPGTLIIPGSVVDAESGKPLLVSPPARWEPDIRLFRPYQGPQLDSARTLELPLHVPPQTTVEGDIFFEIEQERTTVLDASAAPGLEAVDMQTGKWVFFDRAYPNGT